MANPRYFDGDDGRVVADMSDLERQPMLLPNFERLRSSTKRSDFQEPASDEKKSGFYMDPVPVTKEERNAMIRGGLAAGLLIGAVIALGFGLFIFLLTRIGQ